MAWELTGGLGRPLVPSGRGAQRCWIAGVARGSLVKSGGGRSCLVVTLFGWIYPTPYKNGGLASRRRVTQCVTAPYPLYSFFSLTKGIIIII